MHTPTATREALTAAVKTYLRIHDVLDFGSAITNTLVGLLLRHKVTTEAEATRRLALFAGDISAE